MLIDILTSWMRQLNLLILDLYHYIFPEYPEIGSVVLVLGILLFLYYLVRGRAITAAKMAISTLITLSFLLYVLHWLIKLYKVII